MCFICDITTILKLFMRIIQIVVNYYDLYVDLPTNIVVTSQFAHSSNQGNLWDIFETFCCKGPTLFLKTLGASWKGGKLVFLFSCSKFHSERANKCNRASTKNLALSHFINLTFCQLDILPTCHFMNLLFNQLAILLTWHFVNLTFCQLDISSSNCYLINLSFC